MSSIVISGDTSGSVTLQAPAIAGSTILTLQAASGTIALTSGATAFTDLTVTNGASIQGLTVGLGAGAVATNTAVGASALAANTTGATGVAIGNGALQSNTTASNNTAVGYQAGYSNTTSSLFTAIGYQAGYSYNHGAGDVTTLFCGSRAGYSQTSGIYNTYVGEAAGYSMTTGAKNTILGRYTGNQGGLDIRTANNYIVLSDGDGNPRGFFDPNGRLIVGAVSTSESLNSFQYFPGSGANTETILILVNERNNSGGETFIINRQAADGTLIQFRQANTNEGSISVSGTTVSYNGGHLSRWAQTTAPKDDTLVKGTVLSNLDAMNVYTDADGNPVDNEQLNKVRVSDVEGDANVAGVFVNWTHDEQHNVDEINMAMTGDMIIRIAQGTTVARGDLLMSAGNGTAKPQGDDIVRSKTVAKVTSTHITCTYADGSYCVPCVLMAC